MKSLFRIKIFIVLTMLLASAIAANAALLTSNTIGSPTVIDFSQFTAYSPNPFSGPTQVGGLVGRDVTITGTPYDGTNGAWLYNSGWGLLSNGSWDSGRNGFAGYAWEGYMEFTFNDSPVSAIGGLMNEAPGGGSDLIISAFDAGNTLLETYDITLLAPIVTPGGYNVGEFRGIQRSSFDIYKFRISGYVPVVDDLTFSSIPEPASFVLVGSSMGMLFLAMRFRKK